MIRHYLKVAVRNLLKYRGQTAVSVVGLAVGFACFAFSAIWIRYEMTYDAQHKGAERMHLLCRKSAFTDLGYSTGMPLPSPSFLKRHFPEVEEGCAYIYWPDAELKAEGVESIREPYYKHVKLLPLMEYHYSGIGTQDFVKLQYLILFSLIGGLVIICSLFNYLSLFVARMGIRLKELGLRRVCGSSTGGILLMFMTEYGLLVLLSGLAGMTLVELFSTSFCQMSGVEGNVYGESLSYFTGLFLFSFLMLLPFAWHRTPQTLRPGHRRFFFYRCSIWFQIFIGILFIFCVAVLLKQLYHLRTTDLGWERKEVAVINRIYPDSRYDEIADKVAQLPGVCEILKGHGAIFPQSTRLSMLVDGWEGKDAEADGIDMLTLIEDREIIDFYHLRLLEGDIMQTEETDKAILNEAAVKAMGLTDPVGKKIQLHKTDLAIVGVVKDFHTTASTAPVKPTMLIGVNGMEYSMPRTDILLKYHSGRWQELKREAEQLFSTEFPDTRYQLVQAEEEYDKYLKSEQVLMKLLLFVSMVCVCIAAFGIFSLVTLSCEQRRKEIAVRKVNGATVRDILRMFVREYAVLLLLASAVAFPLGYVLMRHWLESYVEQTVISWWIYLSIFVGIALVIALCIGWRVWQTARQNPAEVVKSE